MSATTPKLKRGDRVVALNWPEEGTHSLGVVGRTVVANGPFGQIVTVRFDARVKFTEGAYMDSFNFRAINLTLQGSVAS